MKFGVFDQNDFTGKSTVEQYRKRLDLIELYDRLGFHIYQMSEHHGTPLSTAPSPSVFLAAATQRTKRIRLAPLVYLMPLYNPVRLTEEIIMLDLLSGGRFEFGMGRGASPHELKFLGVDQDEAGDRYTEAVDIVLQGLRSGSITFKGKYNDIDNVPISIRPHTDVSRKLWYAAASPASAVWPARNGLNLMTGGPIAKIATVIDSYFSERPAAQADDEKLAGINRYIVVAETDAEAEAVFLRTWKAFYASFIHLWKTLGGQPKNAIVPENGADLLTSGIAIAGASKTVTQAIEHQRSIGKMTFLSANLAFGDMSDEVCRHSIESFAAQVMPVFSKEARVFQPS